jgi:hypothetical protein
MRRNVMLKRWRLGFGLLAVLAGVAVMNAQLQGPTRTCQKAAPLTVAHCAVPTVAAATAALSRQPVAFVPNLGQWDGEFSHKARTGAMTVFLQERGWTFTLVERGQRPEPDAFAPGTPQPGPTPEAARGVAVCMHFEGGAGRAFAIE